MRGARKIRSQKGIVMKLRSALTALLALAMTAGCSSASEAPEDIETSTSELQTCENADGTPIECDGAGKAAYVLTGFNAATGELQGFNQFGSYFSAPVTNATTFHKANLNKYIPTEPNRVLLVQYNATVQQHAQPYTQLAALTSFAMSARVTIKGNKVKDFRPVPGS